MFTSRSLRLYFIFLVAFIVMLATYAIAAANTVPGTAAGEGSGTVSGYAVSNVQYVLNSSNPANIDKVTFALDAAATTVKVKLVASGSTYYGCANTSGFNWECATTSPQATALTADELRVIAAK